jgi:hypothetical protein
VIPGQPSAAPIALDALVALATQELSDVAQVVDGPPGAMTPADDILFIGWSGDDSPAVITTQATPDMTGRSREEGDVVCVIDCYTGDDVLRPLRQRAQTILSRLVALLRSYPGVDGAVDGAWLGETMEWSQGRVEDGNTVRVAFTVHYVAEL